MAGSELIKADAIFDPPGGAPEFSFEGYVVAYDPGHRWMWFSDTTAGEAGDCLLVRVTAVPASVHCGASPYAVAG